MRLGWALDLVTFEANRLSPPPDFDALVGAFTLAGR